MFMTPPLATVGLTEKQARAAGHAYAVQETRGLMKFVINAETDEILGAVDEHGRSRGLDAVWVAGDATAFPVKSGATAVAQARTVAADIAACCGSPVQCPPVDATAVEELAGLPRKSFLKAWLSSVPTASPRPATS